MAGAEDFSAFLRGLELHMDGSGFRGGGNYNQSAVLADRGEQVVQPAQLAALGAVAGKTVVGQ